MSSNTDTSKLDDLIVTTIDSVKGYEHSAQKADSEKFAELLSRTYSRGAMRGLAGVA